MAISGLPTKPRKTVGKEEEVRLAGEPSPRFHGALTSELHAILERTKPGRETIGDLERALKEGFGDGVAIRISEGARDRLVLADELVGTADALLMHMGEQRARRIIATLEEVIARREQQGDYWPEGRLNLGVAYACLGEYEDARHWLDDAANMLKYPSYIPRSAEMAA
jgi:hypothetical protein